MLVGCTADSSDVVHIEEHLVNEKSNISAILQDAKTRNVWVRYLPVQTLMSVGPGGENSGAYVYEMKERYTLCSEPSPDALSALSASFSAKLSAAMDDITVGGELSKSFQETVQALGQRTETIQLLRDLLFRACEADGNGRIGSFQYALILNSLNEIIIQLVALSSSVGGGNDLSDADNKLIAAEKKAQSALIKANSDEQANEDAVERAESNLSETKDSLNSLRTQKTIQTAASQELKNQIGVLPNDQTEQKQELQKKKSALDLEIVIIDAKIAVKTTTQTRQTKTRDDAITAHIEATRLAAVAQSAFNQASTNAASALKKAKQKSADALSIILSPETKSEATRANFAGACLAWFSQNLNVSKVIQDGKVPAFVVYCDKMIDEFILSFGTSPSE